MKKRFKFMGIFAIAISFAFLLVSCSGSKFYRTFKNAGAEIEEENCFTELTLDEFTAKKENKDDFVILLLNSDSSTSIKNVSIIQYECDNQARDAVVYVFDVVKGLSSVSLGEEMRQTFGVKEIASDLGFVAVGIQDGKLLFDTSNPNDYCDIFKTTSTSINIHAVAQYIFEGVINN